MANPAAASATTPTSIWPWSLRHPLWLCPFRPFFLLTALCGWLLMGLWAAFLFLGWPLPAVAGGPFVWHAHGLLLGFATAAAVGFSLTAAPEFTRTDAFPMRPVRWLAALWLLARVAFWSSGWAPLPALLVAAVADLAVLLSLAALLGPRVWRAPERKHLSFLWMPLLLALATAGFYADALRGLPPARWLQVLLGLFMMLIVVALSRVSTSMVNESLDLATARDGLERDPYLARPPRRNLAVIAIALYTAAEWLQPGGHIAAWLALAAASAALGLLTDWHVGRPLLRRWPLMLYAVYVFMGLGYALIGLAHLGGAWSAHAGLHLLAVGALGLNIYVVICIAGYTHSGLDKDGRNWIPLGAVLLMAGAGLRAAAYFWAPSLLMALASTLWCAAWLLLSWHMLPVFWRPRGDGAAGCAEWIRPAA